MRSVHDCRHVGLGCVNEDGQWPFVNSVGRRETSRMVAHEEFHKIGWRDCREPKKGMHMKQSNVIEVVTFSLRVILGRCELLSKLKYRLRP
jgi:hypothetical protein